MGAIGVRAECSENAAEECGESDGAQSSGDNEDTNGSSPNAEADGPEENAEPGELDNLKMVVLAQTMTLVSLKSRRLKWRPNPTSSA